MSKLYSPYDWYWRHADGRIFGSARRSLVAADDPVFVTWGEDGTTPTPWPRDAAGQPSDDELDAVLAPYGLAFSLPALKRILCARIDVAAEEARSRIATPGSGQAMEYQATQAEARAALNDPTNATAEKYPMLAASIGIDIDPSTGAPATDVVGVARAVDPASSNWTEAGAAIRRVRLVGKAAVNRGETHEAAMAAFEAVSMPTFA